MGDRLVWCRVGSGFVLRIDSRSFVLDVGHETPIAIGVGGIGDNLCASVREGHPVLACHNAILVLDFLLGKICSGISIL